MKYINATDVLDMETLFRLQEEAGGQLIYVPTKNQRKGWGEVSGERSKLKQRNLLICEQAASGMTIQELSDAWYLSKDSIRKILSAQPKSEPVYYLGIDVGGTQIKYGLVDIHGKVQDFHAIDTPKGADALLATLSKLIKEQSANGKISGVGVACAGHISDGIVHLAVNLGLKECPMQKVLQENTGLPVIIENDANCAALCELLQMPGTKNLVYLTIGTGIGCGIVLQGRLYLGSNGRAGEAGHFTLVKDGEPCNCGKRGCFERYASTSALIEQAQRAIALNPDSLLARLRHEGKLSGRTIMQAVAQGCPTAQAVFDRYLDYLACGIESMQQILDPDIVVLSGGITENGDTFFVPLQKRVGKMVVPAKNRSQAGVIGAATLFTIDIRRRTP